MNKTEINIDIIREESKALGILQKINYDNAHNEFLEYAVLYNVKESKKYKSGGLTWKEFCESLGKNVRNVDRTLSDISPLIKHFSDKLSDLSGLNLNKIRSLGKSVSDNLSEIENGSIVIDNKAIQLIPDNKDEIEAAIDSMVEKHKQEKKAIAAEKEKARKEALQGSYDKMIPQLKKYVEKGVISEAAALEHSVLSTEAQNSFVRAELDKISENTRAERDRARLDDLGKEIDKLKAEKERLEEIANTDTATILADKEFELKQARKDYDTRLIKEKETISKEASELHEKRFKDQIVSLEEEKKKLERQKKEATDKASASWGKYKEMQNEIDRLKSQLEVDNPTNVDNARERHIRDSGEGFMIALNELRKDMEKLGGGMEESLTTAAKVIERASTALAELTSEQGAIINI